MRHFDYHITAGRKSQPGGYRFVTARYGQCQIIAITGNKLWFQTDTEVAAISPGQAVLLRQGSAFTLWTEKEGYHGVCFIAIGTLPDEMHGPAQIVTADAELRATVRAMEKELSDPCAESETVLAGLGRAMAWQAIRLARPDSTRRTGRDWAMAARATLDAGVYANCGTRDALGALPKSYRQLVRDFHRTFGQSPKQYQLEARLREACRLLRQTRLPVTTIAMELGYCSSQHFATQFRRHVGCAPSVWGARQAHAGRKT
ncbi:MAG TPA: hypothetical protein DCX07_02025 [Phycisphaerales bacterium]|nr:hypothetical protein [Phycisphaerales bacterium]